MSKIITRSNLDFLALRINTITNSPINKKRIGSYYIAYGSEYENEKKGYQLQRTSTSCGAWHTPLNIGYTTKKNLYYNLRSFIEGIKLDYKVEDVIGNIASNDVLRKSSIKKIEKKVGFYNYD